MNHIASARRGCAPFPIVHPMQAMRAFVFAFAAALALIGVLWPSGTMGQSPPAASASLIVKLVAGLTTSEQAAVIVRNGGIETSSVPALRLHVVQVAADQVDAMLAIYRADA